MRDSTSIRTIVNEICYKPGWKLSLVYDQNRGGAPYLQWEFVSNNVKTGMSEIMTSRKWYLSYYMTESEIVLTAFKAALTAEEHEARESFYYEGRRILNPHVSVRALMEVCDREDVRDE